MLIAEDVDIDYDFSSYYEEEKAPLPEPVDRNLVQFRPAMQGTQRVPVFMHIPVVFDLQ